MQGIQGLMGQKPPQGAPQGAPMAMQQAQQNMQQGQQNQQNRGQDPKATISQELMAALATQKAVKAKEEAMQSLQKEMAEQGMPPPQGGITTVAQANDKKLVDLNLQEMTQRVMPTMQRKMAQQQQQAQQMPQQAMQQAQQAKQGLAQLQQQRAQQQAAYRTGGIVQNFRQGGTVQKFSDGGGATVSPERQKELDALNQLDTDFASVFTPKFASPEKISELRALGIQVPDYVAPEVAERLLAKARVEGRTPQTEPQQTPDPMQTEEDPLVSEGAVDSMDNTPPDTGTGTGTGNVDTMGNLKEVGTSTEQYLGVNGKPIVAPDSAAYIADMEAVGDVSAKPVSMDEVIGDSQKISDYLGISTTTPQDALKAREESYKRHLKDMKYDEIMDKKDAIAKRREQRYMDSQERSTLGVLSDFLIGFGGATTTAAGFTGAAMNLQRGMDKAQQREDQALEAYDEALNDSLATQQDINSKAVAAAEATYNRTLQQRIAEQQMKSSIMNTTQATKQGDARNQLSADIANAERKQATITESYKADLRKYVADVEAKIRQDSPAEVATTLINMLGSVEGYEAAIRSSVMASPEYMQQEGIILDEDSDEKEIADAKERQAQLITAAMSTPTLGMIQAIATDMFEKVYGKVENYTDKNDGYADAAGEDEKPSYAR